MRKARALAVVGTALAAGLMVRRLSARSGVTPAEAAMSRPGDDIIPNPTTVWNRGITILASPSEIWPWLVQMGYGRAGFYVPEWVDRLVWRVPAANSEVLLPQFAHMAVDDVIADGPQYLAYWRVKIVDPERALVFWTLRHPWRGAPIDPADPAALKRREDELVEQGTYMECSWGFYLAEEAAGRTRLLMRTRAVSSPPWLRRMPYGLIDAYISHAELGAIKRRAQASHRTRHRSPEAAPQPADVTSRSR